MWRGSGEKSGVRLIILHHHFRPGGVRRVIELAAPWLVRGVQPAITEVVLAGGESPEEAWWTRFCATLAPVPARRFEEPAFGYLAEQRRNARAVAGRCRRALRRLLEDAAGDPVVVWAHNLGLGRNLTLVRELGRACAARGVPLLAHHHDWWFDNRWARWPEMKRAGFRTMPAVAATLFGPARTQHLVINRSDGALLRSALGRRVTWLPNPAEPAPAISGARREAARRWLHEQLDRAAPVWLVPCRLLRRKNLAEALLLTRWLRPEAWVVTTGAASSAEELPYAERLEAAAQRHGWPLRLAVLAGEEHAKPSIPELQAASEVLLLTSLGEGFGLPYLEAAGAARPLIARRLPNIAPDLARFGFRFPHLYDEVRVAPEWFDWRRERDRQAQLFRAWKRSVAAPYRRFAEPPPLLQAEHPGPVAFNRLTLTAQLEVLRAPPETLWPEAVRLNPWLRLWRDRAAGGALAVTPWPAEADRWLGAAAFAARFTRAWRQARRHPAVPIRETVRALETGARARLRAGGQYPLLWSPRT